MDGMGKVYPMQVSISRLSLGLVGLVFLVLVVAGVRGWLAHGTDLLLGMAESGLSWCF